MAEHQDSPSGFKVVDRRSFSADGTRVSDRPQNEESGPDLRRAVSPPGGHVEAPAAKAAPPEGSKDFEMLVSYLSTTAMFQLGLIAGPDGEYLSPDPAAARQTIGFLEALHTKTLGNLTTQEARLVEDVMYELRMSCLEIEKRMASKRK